MTSRRILEQAGSGIPCCHELSISDLTEPKVMKGVTRHTSGAPPEDTYEWRQGKMLTWRICRILTTSLRIWSDSSAKFPCKHKANVVYRMNDFFGGLRSQHINESPLSKFGMWPEKVLMLG